MACSGRSDELQACSGCHASEKIADYVDICITVQEQRYTSVERSANALEEVSARAARLRLDSKLLQACIHHTHYILRSGEDPPLLRVAGVILRAAAAAAARALAEAHQLSAAFARRLPNGFHTDAPTFTPTSRRRKFETGLAPPIIAAKIPTWQMHTKHPATTLSC
jgi:hypothetical protein